MSTIIPDREWVSSRTEPCVPREYPVVRLTHPEGWRRCYTLLAASGASTAPVVLTQHRLLAVALGTALRLRTAVLGRKEWRDVTWCTAIVVTAG